MRHFPFTMLLLLLPLLTACGNANDGKGLKPFKKSSAVEANPVQVSTSANSLSQFLPCKSPLMVNGGDASFNAAFAGSVLCPTQGTAIGSKGLVARLKVSTGVPANTRLCAIPFVYDAPAAESCFTINGQYDMPLSTDQYTSVVVLAESQLNAYKAYMIDPGSWAPPRVIYSF